MTLLALLTLAACQTGLEPPVSDGAAGPPRDPARLQWVSPRGRVEARLTGWGERGPLLDGDFEPGDWLALEFERKARVDPQAWTLDLVGGGTLPGRPGPLAAGLPGWTLGGLPEVSPMPFDTLWLDGLGRDRVPPRLDEEDLLWTRASGDEVDRRRGYLLDWSDTGVHFEDVAGERVVPWAEVVGLRVLSEQVPEQADAVWIQLANGGSLTARVVSFAEQKLLLELPWGVGWNLPLSAVARIRRRADLQELAAPRADGALAWEVAESPEAEVLDWSPKAGRSVEGRALRLAGVAYPQGIGVHAPAEVTRELDAAGLLYAKVGLDDEVQGYRIRQSVVFEVWLGQKLLHRTPPHGADAAPRTLLVEVPQAGRLRLRAVPAGRIQAGAHADWADLVFLPK